MKRPAFQLYTGDWLSDPALGQCEEATRGIWIDVICNMQRDGACGSLSGTIEQLARVCRTVPERMRLAIDDLRKTGTALVTERDGKVMLVNRRMAQEYKDAQLHAKAQDRYRSKKHNQLELGEVIFPGSKSDLPSSSSSSSSIESTNVDSSFSPTPPSPEEPRPAASGASEAQPIPIAPPPEYWRGFVLVAQSVCMAFTEEQEPGLKKLFHALTEDQRKAAIAGIEIRRDIGQFADLQFVPSMRRYLREKLWTETLRPRARPQPGQAPMDFRERRKQQQDEQFNQLMKRRLEKRGIYATEPGNPQGILRITGS